jgi:hypothetical protein
MEIRDAQERRSIAPWRQSERLPAQSANLGPDLRYEGQQINTCEGLYSINHQKRRLILISIFKKSMGKNSREAERREKQEERRQKAQARGQSAIK